MKKLLLLFALAFVVLACENAPEPTKEFVLQPGTWQMDFKIVDSDSVDRNIPVRLHIDSSAQITIVNHSEFISIEEATITEDSIHLVMPLFNSYFSGNLEGNKYFSGHWHNKQKKDYSIPFEATYISEGFNAVEEHVVPKKYDVMFSPNSEGSYPAIGLFSEGEFYDYGTFLTETGDYRFLEGQFYPTGRIELSCFDGSHLFLFDAMLKEDSIVDGVFFSGKHWEEPWEGVLRADAELRDPDSLTYLKEGYNTVEVDVLSLDGDTVFLNQDMYKDRVSIVQIFGSWCPNCLDENVFYKSLYEDYSDKGFQIIPVAFERGESREEQAQHVQRHFDQLGISYPAYIGGPIGKRIAAEKFNMLNHMMSYPTSIFIDKNGLVRKIHTGFYGPGSGEYYSEYVLSTRMFIEELLAE